MRPSICSASVLVCADRPSAAALVRPSICDVIFSARSSRKSATSLVRASINCAAVSEFSVMRRAALSERSDSKWAAVALAPSTSSATLLTRSVIISTASLVRVSIVSRRCRPIGEKLPRLRWNDRSCATAELIRQELRHRRRAFRQQLRGRAGAFGEQLSGGTALGLDLFRAPD